MQARTVHFGPAKEAMFAVACIAAVCCLSCGGGGSTQAPPVSTPGFSLSSTSIAFANQSVGTVSAPQSATLTNVGDASLTLSSVGVTGSDAGDFTLSNNCGPSLAPSGQCTLSVTFAPSSSGTRSASIVFTDNAAGSPQTVSLSGTGVAPAVSLSTTGLSFGNQAVATTSAPQSATLTNVGDASLTLSSVELTGSNAGDFTLTNNCGTSLAPSGQCSLSVTFQPSSIGARSASIVFTDNAAGSPQTLSLSGTGLAALASLSTTSLSFGIEAIATTSVAEIVTMTNTGNAALNITSLVIAGANVGDFVEIANTCGGSVAPGGTCTIGVTFVPITTGARTATLSITDNAPGSPQTVSLSGTGNHDVFLFWTGSGIDGNVAYNIYRGTTSGGESATPLNATPIYGTIYVDDNVNPGVTYYYVVTAIGANGQQSAPSAETATTVPPD